MEAKVIENRVEEVKTVVVNEGRITLDLSFQEAALLKMLVGQTDPKDFERQANTCVKAFYPELEKYKLEKAFNYGVFLNKVNDALKKALGVELL